MGRGRLADESTDLSRTGERQHLDPGMSGQRLAGIAQGGKAQAATYVFTNVDMFADAKRFKRAMGV